jgi:predicted nucleotide-binding protein
MQKQRIFIASSSKAKAFASILAEEMKSLNKEKSCNEWEIFPWFDDEKTELAQKRGTSILKGLIDECKRVDFAVTLMTKDELIISGNETKIVSQNNSVKDDNTNSSKKTKMVPGGNCIFEAGLFMGGLGLDSERSVIMTTMKDKDKPSDLSGIRHFEIRISEEEFGNNESCKKEANRLANAFHKHCEFIKEPPKRPFLPVYTQEELVEREKSTNDGGDLVDDFTQSVVVNTFEPIEIKVSLAKRVVENMDRGILYHYFFRADTSLIPKVARLIQSLVLAKLGVEKDLHENKERIAMIKNNTGPVKTIIEEIQKKLSIQFVPKDRLPLYFCVHNANDNENACCYLRHEGNPDGFIRWAEGKAAKQVASDLLKIRDLPDENAIFYPTKYFDLYKTGTTERELKVSILNNLEAQFSKDVWDNIRQQFFIT